MNQKFKLFWNVSILAAIVSFLLVVVQIWFAPFPKDFYGKLLGTWTAFVITLFVISFIDRIFNKE